MHSSIISLQWEKVIELMKSTWSTSYYHSTSRIPVMGEGYRTHEADLKHIVLPLRVGSQPYVQSFNDQWTTMWSLLNDRQTITQRLLNAGLTIVGRLFKYRLAFFMTIASKHPSRSFSDQGRIVDPFDCSSITDWHINNDVSTSKTILLKTDLPFGIFAVFYILCVSLIVLCFARNKNFHILRFLCFKLEQYIWLIAAWRALWWYDSWRDFHAEG